MYTTRGEFHKEPPPDIEFPHFEVIYYDQPASAGIRFKTTDARSERWPDSTQEFHSDGSISGLKPSSDDTQHQWRQKLGELLTSKFLLSDEQLSVHLQPMIGRRCFLIDFPPNYKMFTHTKDGRIDHYLIGSKTVSSFRSPQEFFVHARWLMTGAEKDHDGDPACGCKYCSGTRSQTAIDREFQLPGSKDSRHKNSKTYSGRHGASSTAATSEVIISQAKDYRNLKKPNPEAQQTASKGVESIDLTLP
jgi:hypothetical protein